MLPSVFISYSHEDKAWKDRLVKHLKGLEHVDRLRSWDDSRIGTGQTWRQEIEAAIEEARVAVLLVSPEFLASEFIQAHEAPRLLERRDQGDVHIVPVIVRDCLWEETFLSSLQVRPRGRRALESFSEAEQSTELKEIAKEILDFLPPRASESTSVFRPLHQRTPWRDLFTTRGLMGISVVLAAVIGLQEVQYKSTWDHLSKAAQYLGLRDDACLYSEPSYRDAEEPMVVKLTKAREEIESARRAARWILWGRDRAGVRAYQLEAEAWLFEKKYENALQCIARGLAIEERSLGLITDKAAVLKDQGRLREAEEELAKAYQNASKRAEGKDLGPGLDEDLACAAVSLGLLRTDLPGKAKSAEPLFKEALRRYPNRFFTQWGYGQYLYRQNEAEKALEYLERAARIDPMDATNRLQIAEIHFNLAEAGRASLFHYGQARPHYEEGFKYEDLLSVPLPNVKEMYVNFGKTLFQLGDVERARENLEKGLLEVDYDRDHDIWRGNSFLLLSQAYACLQLWDLFEESLDRGRQYHPGLAGILGQFRMNRDPEKWTQWGCTSSLTPPQKTAPTPPS